MENSLCGRYQKITENRLNGGVKTEIEKFKVIDVQGEYAITDKNTKINVFELLDESVYTRDNLENVNLGMGEQFIISKNKPVTELSSQVAPLVNNQIIADTNIVKHTTLVNIYNDEQSFIANAINISRKRGNVLSSNIEIGVNLNFDPKVIMKCASSLDINDNDLLEVIKSEIEININEIKEKIAKMVIVNSNDFTISQVERVEEIKQVEQPVSVPTITNPTLESNEKSEYITVHINGFYNDSIKLEMQQDSNANIYTYEDFEHHKIGNIFDLDIGEQLITDIKNKVIEYTFGDADELHHDLVIIKFSEPEFNNKLNDIITNGFSNAMKEIEPIKEDSEIEAMPFVEKSNSELLEDQKKITSKLPNFKKGSTLSELFKKNKL